MYFLAATLTLMSCSAAWNGQFWIGFGVVDCGIHKGAKDFRKCRLFVHALFMIKTDQFLNSKVMEATAAYPSTGNPELNS